MYALCAACAGVATSTDSEFLYFVPGGAMRVLHTKKQCQEIYGGGEMAAKKKAAKVKKKKAAKVKVEAAVSKSVLKRLAHQTKPTTKPAAASIVVIEGNTFKEDPMARERETYPSFPTTRPDDAPEDLPYISEVAADEAATVDFLTLADAYAAERARKADAETQMEKIARKLEARLEMLGVDSVGCYIARARCCGKVRVREREGSWRVSEEKLLEAGVEAATVAACKVQGKTSSYIEVWLPKAAKTALGGSGGGE